MLQLIAMNVTEFMLETRTCHL